MTAAPAPLPASLPDVAGGDIGFPTLYYFATALAVGVTVMLPLVPIAQIGRRFFILMTLIAVVFHGIAIVARGLGFEYLHAASAGLLILYNVFVPERGNLPALVLLLLAGILGIGGLLADAIGYPVAVPVSAGGAAWLAITFLGSSLILGSALVSMLLGHWYLVAHGLSFGILGRLVLALIVALALRAVVGGSVAFLQADVWQGLWSEAGGAARFLMSSGLFVGARVLFGLLLPVVLALMARECVRIRSNQSATGILYVLVAFVILGEAIAKHLMVSNGLLV